MPLCVKKRPETGVGGAHHLPSGKTSPCEVTRLWKRFHRGHETEVMAPSLGRRDDSLSTGRPLRTQAFRASRTTATQICGERRRTKVFVFCRQMATQLQRCKVRASHIDGAMFPSVVCQVRAPLIVTILCFSFFYYLVNRAPVKTSII